MKKFSILPVFALVLTACGDTKYETTPALEEFKQCVVDSGAVFYGTEWCPHCEAQRVMLGGYDHYDCDRHSSVCKEKEITSYPTWIYADGTRAQGVQQLQSIAEATGCDLDPSLIPEDTTEADDTTTTTQTPAGGTMPNGGETEVTAPEGAQQ